MNEEDWNYNLIVGIVFTLLFIGLLTVSEPIKFPSLPPIDVQIVRMLFVLIAVINFASYIGLKK